MKRCLLCGKEAHKYVRGNPTKVVCGRSKTKTSSLSMEACDEHATIIENFYNEMSHLIHAKACELRTQHNIR